MEIEWGPEIAVDGKRPEWLGDGDEVIRVTNEARTEDHTSIVAESATYWPNVGHIRLPASHPAYIAIAKGFTPWSGGDEAPGDWDEGDVLRYGGGVYYPEPWVDSYECNQRWFHVDYKEGKWADIIGYRRKPEAISPQPIGSGTVTGLSIKVDTTELKAAIAATASYTVTRDGLTITGPDLVHILRSIKEGGNDPA